MELRRLPASLSRSSLSRDPALDSGLERFKAPVRCSLGASLVGVTCPGALAPGIPENGNMGKWFDMRFDMDMEEGGRGTPVPTILGLELDTRGNTWPE